MARYSTGPYDAVYCPAACLQPTGRDGDGTHNSKGPREKNVGAGCVCVFLIHLLSVLFHFHVYKLFTK